MKLYYHPLSPFVRKVLITAAENGLGERIGIVDADTQDEALRAINPLSKIPALVLDDGETLYDSRVICEYLDALGAGALIPPAGPARWAARKLEALGDGIGDATLRIAMENRRPQADRHADVIVRQGRAIAAALAEAERLLQPDRFTLGEAALASAMIYMQLRAAPEGWRAAHPRLSDWFDAVLQRPSLVQTAPKT
jgi:glutathione S-transferase